MKRFISYLLLCCSIFLAVFVSFDQVFFNVNTGADFGSGREFIYQIRIKNENDNYINGNNGFVTKAELETEIDKVVDEMKSRLDLADVTNAVVEKLGSTETSDGYYSIRVAYKAQYEQLYGAINEFLLFDRNLSATFYQEPHNFAQFSDDGKTSQLFKLGEAEVDNSEALPIVKIPLADPQKFNDEVFKVVVGEEEEPNNAYNPVFKAGEVVAPDVPTEGGEEEPAPENDEFVYIVNNWKDKYTIKDALEKEDYSTEAKNSVVYRFNVKSPETMFYKYDSTSTKNEFLMLDYTQYAPDLSAITDRAVLQRIIHSFANMECAKLNSTPYDLDIVMLNQSYPAGSGIMDNSIPPFVEAIRQYGKLTVSSLLIATIVSFVLVTLFMALNYGMNVLTGMSVGSATVLLSVGMLSLFGVEFNIGTIVALIIVAIASIFSSCIYFKSIRENCYEGKNLKKATAEAGKKTFMYHVDISAILIILGVIGYVMENSLLMSMGAIFICGGIFNFILSAIALRGLTWLLSNSSYIEEHIGLLKIEKRLIPDLLNDEKPVYYDSYKQIKSNKTRNIIVASVAGALLLGSIIAIPTVSAIKGDVYGKAPETTLNSQVYIEYTIGYSDENIKGFATPAEIEENVLKNIYTINEDGTKGAALKYDDIKSMYYQTTDDKGIKKLTFTYIIGLNKIHDKAESYNFLPDESSSIDQGLGLIDAIKSGIKVSGATPSIYLMDVANRSDDTLNYNILIFTVIGVAISSAYILLRFGLGKGLISLVAVGGVSTISVGVFSMLQVGLTSASTLAVIIVTVIGYAILLHYFNRERTFLKDNKAKIRDLETKQEYLRLSSNLSFSTILTALALGLFIIISFLLAKAFAQGIVLISALGLLFIILFAQALLLPMDNINKKCWNKTKEIVNFDGFGKKKGNEKKAKKHADGPQEAVIPGIND